MGTESRMHFILPMSDPANNR